MQWWAGWRPQVWATIGGSRQQAWKGRRGTGARCRCGGREEEAARSKGVAVCGGDAMAVAAAARMAWARRQVRRKGT